MKLIVKTVIKGENITLDTKFSYYIGRFLIDKQ